MSTWPCLWHRARIAAKDLDAATYPAPYWPDLQLRERIDARKRYEAALRDMALKGLAQLHATLTKKRGERPS